MSVNDFSVNRAASNACLVLKKLYTKKQCMLKSTGQTWKSADNQSAKGYHRKDFIMEVVNAVNEGLPAWEARQRYGIAKNTLVHWMQKYGAPQWHQQRRQQISASIKRKVVRAIEQGHMTTQEARLAYNIGCDQTIRRWKRELKAENTELVGSNPSVMKDKSADNKAVNNNLATDVKALQKALEEAEMKVVALNTLIDVAERQLKINIRKKPGAKQ